MQVAAVFALFVSLLAAAPSVAQERATSMAGTVGERWSLVKGQFVSLAEAMPADKYDFKPTTGAFKDVRTFGEQVKHVACANVAFANEIAHKNPPPDCETGGTNPAHTKTELLKYLRESFGECDKAFAALTPGNALDPIDGRYGGPSTRLGMLTLAVWHATDHYGQLVVYLRMNGIVPPASAGAAR